MRSRREGAEQYVATTLDCYHTDLGHAQLQDLYTEHNTMNTPALLCRVSAGRPPCQDAVNVCRTDAGDVSSHRSHRLIISVFKFHCKPSCTERHTARGRSS